MTNHKAGGLCIHPQRKVLKALADTMPPKLVLWKEQTHIDDCAPLEDQGEVNACACYAVGASLQAALWRKNGYPVDILELNLYEWANANDGIPGPHEGTTLEAAVQAAVEMGYAKGYFTSEVNTIDEFKWAVGQCRGCICGLNVTDKWNQVGVNGIIPDGGSPIGGHGLWYPTYKIEGPVCANSWGLKWAINGFGQTSWDEFKREFIYELAVEWVL